MLSSGNIFGNAFGVMLFATFDKYVGETYELSNSTPAYLVLGAISAMLLAFTWGVAMCAVHPHDVVRERGG